MPHNSDLRGGTRESTAGPVPQVPQLPAAVLALLRCPVCRGPVDAGREVAQCRAAACHARYPVAGGVPVLIDDGQSVFRADDVAAQLRTVGVVPAAGPLSYTDVVRRLTPSIDHNRRRQAALERLVSLCRSGKNGELRILLITGLQGPDPQRPLPRWESAQPAVVVNAAVLPCQNPAISCDPQRLPFEDKSFDAVVVLDVLHQAVDPRACAGEIHRVLVDKGLVYADSPFVQPAYQGPHDFQRFTLLGHRRIFRRFEEIESGEGAGPGAGLAWAWRSFLGSLSNSRVMSFLLRTLGSFTGFFLQYLDPMLKNRPASLDGAASVYFLGSSSEKTLSDQELVAGYRGRVRTYWTPAALRPATEVFSAWAAAGLDGEMARVHAPAVREMVQAAMSALAGTGDVRAIDVGCGNGWVVRMLRKHPVCRAASGVDGSAEMIAKARSLDPEGDYVLADIVKWTPAARVNLVHAMEVIYYLDDPIAFLRRVRCEWLEPGGVVILGVDHYAENEASLAWPESLGVRMTTLSEADWHAGLCAAGFSDVRVWRAGSNGGAGTLAMLARAPL